MKIPEEAKLGPNLAVVFKKHFDFNGVKCNAVMQREDGSLMFFDTEHLHTDGTLKVSIHTIAEVADEAKN